jgi:hypothetical protein
MFEKLTAPQSLAMWLGAVVGVIVWVAIRGRSYDPGLFDSVVTGAWTFVGGYAVVRGELTLAGRGGKSPRTHTRTKARLLGLTIIAMGVVFFLAMSQR